MSVVQCCGGSVCSYGFLQLFEVRPEQLELRRDGRSGQLQRFNDVSGVTNLLSGDEGVRETLPHTQRERERELDVSARPPYTHTHPHTQT